MLEETRWPSLAQDLAVMSVPDSPITNIQEVCTTYNISMAELKDLLKIPRFAGLLEESADYFKAQGPKAGTIYRTTALSHALTEKIFADSMRGAVESKDMIKFLELLYKASGLMMPEKDSPQVNTQVNVGVQLPLPRGLHNRKLQHMALEE